MIRVPASLQEGLLWQLLRSCVVLLGLLIVALLVGALLVITRDPPPALAPAPGTLTAVSLEVPDAPSGALEGEMVTRPLFWSSRRPPVVEAAVVEPEAQPVSGADALDQARLLGILASGDRTGAILAVGEQRMRLMQGESLEGWVLESLDGTRAVFVREDGAQQPVYLTLEHAQVRRPEGAQEPPNEQGDKQ